MKTSLLAAALITSCVLSSQAQAKLGDFLKNPAEKYLGNLNDVYAGVTFSYLDREDRLLIVNDFLKTVELEYVLLPLKAERIGLDFKKLKADAIAQENAVENILLTLEDRRDLEAKEKISFLQAKSNMDFLDRMQALVAKFQDTHFSIQEKIARPMIYNGLRLFRIQGKIIVGSIETKFLGMAGKLTATDFSKIKVGDEVISIDGVPVEEKIKEMKKYIGSSSDEFLDSQAVRCLTLRNFNYEQKNFMRMTFKSAGSFKLPVFANIPTDSTPRLDAMTFFKKFGIQSDSATIGVNFDKITNKWTDSALTFDGYSTKKLHLNLKGVVEMMADNGTPALRTGLYVTKGKSYAVLQILTFSTTNVKIGTAAQPFLDAIRNYILEVKEMELPLILDLRVNGGGNGNFPGAVLSILAGDKANYAGGTYGLRMTHYARQLQEPYLFQEISGEELTSELSIDEFKDMINNTLENQLDYSPMYTNGAVTPDAKVKGFNNKIVALVTADCISACDMMSFLLKSSKRATIIGTHSNGTGAGYRSTGELNTDWEDRLRVLSTTIPNFLFGFPGENSETKIFEEKSVSRLCSENIPTVADIPYSPTMTDVSKNSVGWLQKAVEVLESNK